MTSQCGPQRPNLNKTKMRRRYDVACQVGVYIIWTQQKLIPCLSEKFVTKLTDLFLIIKV